MTSAKYPTYLSCDFNISISWPRYICRNVSRTSFLWKNARKHAATRVLRARVPWQWSTTTWECGSRRSQDWIEVQIMNRVSRGGHGRPGKVYSRTCNKWVSELLTYWLVERGVVVGILWEVVYQVVARVVGVQVVRDLAHQRVLWLLLVLLVGVVIRWAWIRTHDHPISQIVESLDT